MPSVAKFKWTSVKQLSGWKDASRRKLYDAIKKDVELLLQQTIAFGCSTGRTRSPVCAIAYCLALKIGSSHVLCSCMRLHLHAHR